MAIFNKNDSAHQSVKPDSSTTIITVGSKIKGEMHLTCNLYVDGEFEGTINSKKEVNIGKHGHIKGDVFTNRLVVQGFVEGLIDAEKVEIKADGRVKGTIESSELIIESKGIFEGNSILKNSSLPVKEKGKEPSKETVHFSDEKKTLESIKVPEPEALKK